MKRSLTEPGVEVEEGRSQVCLDWIALGPLGKDLGASDYGTLGEITTIWWFKLLLLKVMMLIRQTKTCNKYNNFKT